MSSKERSTDTVAEGPDQQIQKMLQEQMQTLAAHLTKEEEGDPKYALKSAANRKEQHALEIATALKELQQEFYVGFEALFESIETLRVEEPALFTDTLMVDLLKYLEFFRALSDNPTQAVKEITEEKKTIAEICEFGQATLDFFNLIGEKALIANEFEKAIGLYHLLTQINAKNYRWWLGLGNAYFFCNRFEEALDAYLGAQLAEPRNVYGYLYSAACHEKNNNIADAIEELDLAISMMANEPALQELKKQAEADRKRMNIQLRSNK